MQGSRVSAISKCGNKWKLTRREFTNMLKLEIIRRGVGERKKELVRVKLLIELPDN